MAETEREAADFCIETVMTKPLYKWKLGDYLAVNMPGTIIDCRVGVIVKRRTKGDNGERMRIYTLEMEDGEIEYLHLNEQELTDEAW